MLLFGCMIYLILLTQHCICLNNKPIIGILVQDLPSSKTSAKRNEPTLNVTGTTFLAAEYVKWIESAGGRVVPILGNHTEESLREIFSYINGLLLPGGSASYKDSPYRRNGEIIYKLAIEAYDNGDYFPIWGTCLGMQMLSVITAQNSDIVFSNGGTFDKVKKELLMSNAWSSRLFSKAQPYITDILELEAVAWMAHLNCVLADSFIRNEMLRDFYTVLSVNKDDLSSKIYSSIIEGKRYPFYGTQWHPEMNLFGFSGNHDRNVNHSEDAVLVSQYLANFFVSEARNSNHHFPNRLLEEKSLIFNYSPYYSGFYGWEHIQIYVF